MLLSFSRGAVLAAALGAAFWFATVPRRLRGAAVLIAGSAGGALVAAWAFSQDALSDDRVALALREQAGLQLGLLLVVMLGLLASAGLAIGFVRANHTPSLQQRDRAGVALLVALALLPIGGLVALTLGDRGLSGSISARWEQLTDPSAPLPGNDTSRLTASGSVRARYWDEALRIFRTTPASASARAATRSSASATATPTRRCATRTATSSRRSPTSASRGSPSTSRCSPPGSRARSARRACGGAIAGARTRPSGSGLLTLFAVVLVFGVHSFVDWTWFVPANAVVALLAAGWIAGRGPLGEREDAAARTARPARTGRQRPPARRAAARRHARAFARHLRGGRGADRARRGVDRVAAAARRHDRAERATRRSIGATSTAPAPTPAARARSTRCRWIPATRWRRSRSARGHNAAARRALRDAVRLQPANPDPWVRLAELELNTLKSPKRALTAIRPALYLDPRSSDAVAVFLAAQRQISAP